MGRRHPSSLAQGSLIESALPTTIPESIVFVEVPFVDDAITLQPITINDEILGQDKRKVQLTVGPKNKTAACLKDGKVLRKFWGDETLIVLMSLTLKPTLALQMLISIWTLLVTLKKSKRGRPKKQRSPTQSTGSQAQQYNSNKSDKEFTHTKSKAGSKYPNESNISQ